MAFEERIGKHRRELIEAGTKAREAADRRGEIFATFEGKLVDSLNDELADDSSPIARLWMPFRDTELLGALPLIWENWIKMQERKIEELKDMRKDMHPVRRLANRVPKAANQNYSPTINPPIAFKDFAHVYATRHLGHENELESEDAISNAIGRYEMCHRSDVHDDGFFDDEQKKELGILSRDNNNQRSPRMGRSQEIIMTFRKSDDWFDLNALLIVRTSMNNKLDPCIKMRYKSPGNQLINTTDYTSVFSVNDYQRGRGQLLDIAALEVAQSKKKY